MLVTINRAPVPMSEEEYLGLFGLRAVFSDFMLDKMRIPHGLTLRQWNKLQRDASAAADEYQGQRAEKKAEYAEKVAAGELRPLSTVEKLLKKAHGHEDHESTHAARRVLEKRGIDWREGSAALV